MKDSNQNKEDPYQQVQDVSDMDTGEPTLDVEDKKRKMINIGIALVIAVIVIVILLNSFKSKKPTAATPNNSPAVTVQSTSNLNKQDIQKVVKDYISDNPEIIMDAIHKLEQKMTEQKAKESKDFIDKNMAQLTSSEPYIGNKDGKITIIEFFDYKCGYCKRNHMTLKKLLSEYSNLKIILKNVPILGSNSNLAAQASLAVWKTSPKDFANFHDDLISANDINNQVITDIAQKYNIPKDALLSQMSSTEIQNALNSNMQMAQQIGVRGVPAYIINDEFVPGGMSYEAFKQKIDAIQKTLPAVTPPTAPAPISSVTPAADAAVVTQQPTKSAANSQAPEPVITGAPTTAPPSEAGK